MRQSVILLSAVLVGTNIFSGCSSDPRAATTENFGHVISAVYESPEKSNLCDDESTPVNMDVPDQSKRYQQEVHTYEYMEPDYKKIAALRDEHFLVASAPQHTNTGETYVHYSATGDNGTRGIKITLEKSPLDLAGPIYTYSIHMCSKRIAFDHIIDFSEPADAFGMHISNVKYMVKVVESQPWASDPKMLAAFPAITSTSNQMKQPQTMTLLLSNKGWKNAADH